jgi:GNAT superfamily N-acetyltransferase
MAASGFGDEALSVLVRALLGEEQAQVLPRLAELRIEVFRDFPYLYEGNLDYERRYLGAYAASKNAVIVGAFDGARLVGAATAAPMEDHAKEFAAPFRERGFEPEEILYCGESVLLAAYRGHGIGHKFFDLREAHGRALGRKYSAFCGVVRPPDHPARPKDYSPLDGFWQKRGYRKLDGVVAEFSWPDIGETAPSKKPMQFWLREL